MIFFLILQEICKKLAATIDKIDEARYDAEAKVQKADKEVSNTSSMLALPRSGLPKACYTTLVASSDRSSVNYYKLITVNYESIIIKVND